MEGFKLPSTTGTEGQEGKGPRAGEGVGEQQRSCPGALGEQLLLAPGEMLYTDAYCSTPEIII